MISPSFRKFLHPQEVLVEDGLVSEDLLALLRSSDAAPAPGPSPVPAGLGLGSDEELRGDRPIEGFSFVYPHGCSLSLLNSSENKAQGPATPLLTTGALNFPVREAVMALRRVPSGGRVLLSGSFRLFADEYLAKEQNAQLVGVVFDAQAEKAERVVAAKPPAPQDFCTRKSAPLIEKMSGNLKCAFECNPDLSSNIFSLFENNLFKVHFDLQREAIELHKRLNIERRNLTLIAPVFETPMLGLTPAVFPPVLVEIDTPGLELYDLDDEFANPT